MHVAKQNTWAFLTLVHRKENLPKNRNPVHLHVALLRRNKAHKYKNEVQRKKVHYSATASFLHTGSGHRTSSTSQATFSLAWQRGKKTPGMPYPGLTCLHAHVTTGQFHGLQEIYPGVRLAFIYLPPPRGGEFFNGVQERGAQWKAKIDKTLVHTEPLPNLEAQTLSQTTT